MNFSKKSWPRRFLQGFIGRKCNNVVEFLGVPAIGCRRATGYPPVGAAHFRSICETFRVPHAVLKGGFFPLATNLSSRISRISVYFYIF